MKSASCHLGFNIWVLNFYPITEIASSFSEGLTTTRRQGGYYKPRYVFLIVSSLSSSSAVPWAITCPLDMT